MINFLRRIRRRLIEQKNVKRYFLYAIGEIILIVIGILIALQLNNWNNNKKDQTLESELLKGIKSDLIADTTQINNRFYSSYNNLNKSIKIYDSIIKLDKAKINIKYLDSIFERCIRQRNTFFPKSGTYNAIISNGKSNIFSNNELFKEIQHIYDFAYRVTLESGARIDDFSDKLRYKYNYSKALKNDERLEFYLNPNIRNEIEFWFNEYSHFKGLIEYNINQLNVLFPKIDDELNK